MVFVIDSNNAVQWIDMADTRPAWLALPGITGGVDFITVGDQSNNETGNLLLALNKYTPSTYFFRSVSDKTAAWIQGNNSQNDPVRDMVTLSFGGVTNKFVFGALVDGNYAVTGWPNGGWVKNWGKDMGSQKPARLSQLVSCALKNYGLDEDGSLFSFVIEQNDQAFRPWVGFPSISPDKDLASMSHSLSTVTDG